MQLDGGRTFAAGLAGRLRSTLFRVSLRCAVALYSIVNTLGEIMVHYSYLVGPAQQCTARWLGLASHVRQYEAEIHPLLLLAARGRPVWVGRALCLYPGAQGMFPSSLHVR